MNDDQLKEIEERRVQAIERFELPYPRCLDGIGIIMSNDIPPLLVEVRRLKAENEQLKAELKEA